MENTIPRKWQEVIAGFMEARGRKDAAKWLRQKALTLVYGFAPNGNAADVNSESGTLEADRKFWTREAFDPATRERIGLHLGINPLNALDPLTVFATIAHASCYGVVYAAMQKVAKDGIVKGRVYGEAFTKMVSGILVDPDAAEKGRASASRMFRFTPEAKAEALRLISDLPTLPFVYLAEKKDPPTFVNVQLYSKSGRIYRDSVPKPNTGADEETKAKRNADCLRILDSWEADGLTPNVDGNEENGRKPHPATAEWYASVMALKVSDTIETENASEAA